MKKFFLILSSLFAIIIITLIIQSYLHNKTTYLKLSFYNVSGNKVDIYKIEVAKDINLGSYDADDLTGLTLIDDKGSINKIIDYLNSIPLNLSNKKALHTNCDKKCCTIFFYDDKGIQRGWVAIHNNVIQRSKDLSIFTTKEKYPEIISGLKQSLTETKETKGDVH